MVDVTDVYQLNSNQSIVLFSFFDMTKSSVKTLIS